MAGFLFVGESGWALRLVAQPGEERLDIAAQLGQMALYPAHILFVLNLQTAPDSSDFLRVLVGPKLNAHQPRDETDRRHPIDPQIFDDGHL